MSYRLTVSAKGQITLKKALLAHLGVRPGDEVGLELKAGGVVELRPAPKGATSAFFGMLKRAGRPRRTIEQINEAIEDGWTGKR